MATPKKKHHSYLPKPLELAKLAALVDQESSASAFPDAAIKKAVRLYLHAQQFYRNNQNATLEEIALAVGDNFTWLDLWCSRSGLNRTLCLKVGQRTDEVRRYLAKNGLKLTTARSVLENAKDCARFYATRLWVEHFRRQPLNVKAGMTQKEKDEAVQQQALELGWSLEKWEQLWDEGLRAFEEKNSGDHGVYQLSMSLLTRLIEWKRDRKVSGGKKSVSVKKSAE